MLVFNNYSEKEKLLFDSLNSLKDYKALVLSDEAFLPGGFTSIYELYLKQFESSLSIKDIYFAFLDIPNYYRILPYNERGAIYNGEIKKGNIYVREPISKRYIDHIDWLYDNRIYRRDYYNRYGYVYKCDYFNYENVIVETAYYTSSFKEVMSLNHSNGYFYILDKNGLKRYYESVNEFIKDYIKQINFKEPLYLTSNNQIELFKDKEYKELFNDDFCYINKETINHIETKQNNKNVLILTKSDRMKNLEEIVTSLSEYNFYIGANTAFSNKINILNKYNNVFLYPTITSEDKDRLFNKCSIYLDINDDNGYPLAIEKASVNGLVILGYKYVLKNSKYVLEDNVFDDSSSLINKLKNFDYKNIAYRQYIMQENKFKVGINL